MKDNILNSDQTENVVNTTSSNGQSECIVDHEKSLETKKYVPKFPSKFEDIADMYGWSR